MMDRMPTVFVSHGAPTLALNPGLTGAAWRNLAAALPTPEAILVVSAHWETAVPEITATARPETIHDFGGFPEPLYRLQYPAPGAPTVAERLKQLLEAAGLPVESDPRRGLDHGAWVPLQVMYPKADIPVLQLSVQPRLGVQHHLRLGQAIETLPSEGVLIIGSGSLTHNLREVKWGVDDPQAAPDYVRQFQDWCHDRLVANDRDALIRYRTLAPAASRAHPTEEHLLPLFVAWSAASEPVHASRRHAGITEGVLAMDVYTFHTADAITSI